MKVRRFGFWLTLLAAVLVGGALNVVAADEGSLSEGLVAYWPFDNDFESVVPGGPSGTTFGGNPQLVPGIIGNAVQFRGFADYLNVGGGAELQPPQLSVSFWIRRTGNMSGGEYLIFWAKPGSGPSVWAQNGWFFTIDDRGGTGELRLWVNGDGNIVYHPAGDFNAYFPENEWVHIVFTFDSNTGEGKIYRNGVPQWVGTYGNPTLISPSGDPLWIGFNGPALNGAYLPATLDEVRIYNRILTNAEVQQLYALAGQ